MELVDLAGRRGQNRVENVAAPARSTGRPPVPNLLQGVRSHLVKRTAESIRHLRRLIGAHKVLRAVYFYWVYVFAETTGRDELRAFLIEKVLQAGKSERKGLHLHFSLALDLRLFRLWG